MTSFSTKFSGVGFFLLVGAALFLMAGCQGNAPASDESNMAGDTQMTEETVMMEPIPEDSTDEMDSNLDKALMELDLVE